MLFNAFHMWDTIVTTIDLQTNHPYGKCDLLVRLLFDPAETAVLLTQKVSATATNTDCNSAAGTTFLRIGNVDLHCCHCFSVLSGLPNFLLCRPYYHG